MSETMNPETTRERAIAEIAKAAGDVDALRKIAEALRSSEPSVAKILDAEARWMDLDASDPTDLY